MKKQKMRKLWNSETRHYVCSNCSTRLGAFQTKCPNCHKVLGEKYFGCAVCGKEYSRSKSICPWCNNDASMKNLKMGKFYESAEPSALPMKWYNFATYIMCPLGIIRVIYAMLYNINNNGELIFTVFYLFGALLVGILMYGLYKKTIWSWKLLLGFYIFNSIFGRIDYLEVLLPLLYLVFIIVINIVLTIPSYVYFNKRKHLFVN